MTIGTRLFTLFKGKLVGIDQQGNRYFVERRAGRKRKPRRWVLYHGIKEASRVPPEWHGWLHHTVDTTPMDSPPEVKPWQKAHQPNATGTRDAYHPSGHDYEGANRPPATGDYEPWRPA